VRRVRRWALDRPGVAGGGGAQRRRRGRCLVDRSERDTAEDVDELRAGLGPGDLEPADRVARPAADVVEALRHRGDLDPDAGRLERVVGLLEGVLLAPLTGERDALLGEAV